MADECVLPLVVRCVCVCVGMLANLGLHTCLSVYGGEDMCVTCVWFVHAVRCTVGVGCIVCGWVVVYTIGTHNVARAHAPHCAAAESDFGLCHSLSLAGLLAHTVYR